ncbi:RNA polymerase sigma-70 factor, ECF subfamily [Pedobacter sp. ok626]|uniref:RNA polymerase sigma factor n=1 Tax=Pedobacter sp. ok626 TaxID=1761882 RepID=UPI000884B6BF|nr:RNA polymerase sigma-70 factor [Pedobacter sp. ok626]SDK59392.1 RNA polymerase sigma-70 factor, ECF subfamily [Pedobacter sp. ok626]
MVLKPHYNDVELLQKIAAGDEHAFSLFYYRYSKTVFLFAYRILDSESYAEELMQEVMLKIWMLGDELINVNNIESYLRVMCRNRCYNRLRQLRREAGKNKEATIDWKDESNETEETILLNEAKGLLEKAIAKLPAQQREVYNLCQIQGLKYEEAAKQLNISVLTVQSYMKIALRSVRNAMRNHSGVAAILTILKLF